MEGVGYPRRMGGEAQVLRGCLRGGGGFFFAGRKSHQETVQGVFWRSLVGQYHMPCNLWNTCHLSRHRLSVFFLHIMFDGGCTCENICALTKAASSPSFFVIYFSALHPILPIFPIFFELNNEGAFAKVAFGTLRLWLSRDKERLRKIVSQNLIFLMHVRCDLCSASQNSGLA